MYLERVMNSWSLLASRTQTKQKSVHQKVFIDPLKMYGPRWRPKRAAAIGAKHKFVKYGPYFGWHFPQFFMGIYLKISAGNVLYSLAESFWRKNWALRPAFWCDFGGGPQLGLHLMDWSVHLRSASRLLCCLMHKRKGNVLCAGTVTQKVYLQVH